MKNTKILVLCTLILLIASIGVSFAIVNMTLDIRGKMTMSAANWDVHFENLSDPVITGEAVEMDKPYIADNSTSIVNLNAKLQTYSDSIYYLFDVYNGGGLDAEISAIQIANPVCKGTGEQSTEDAAVVCRNIKYEMTYADGTKVQKGDVLGAQERKKLKLNLFYSGTEMPLNEVDISNLSIAIIYTQN